MVLFIAHTTRVEIATSDVAVLVKVDSPKKRLLNRTDEWLPYDARIMRPLTVEDIERDEMIYNRQLAEITANYTRARETLRQALNVAVPTP